MQKHNDMLQKKEMIFRKIVSFCFLDLFFGVFTSPAAHCQAILCCRLLRRMHLRSLTGKGQ